MEVQKVYNEESVEAENYRSPLCGVSITNSTRTREENMTQQPFKSEGRFSLIQVRAKVTQNGSDHGKAQTNTFTFMDRICTSRYQGRM